MSKRVKDEAKESWRGGGPGVAHLREVGVAV